MKQLLLMLLLITILNAEAQDGSTLFRQNCASCHRIGKGRLTGPDLKEVYLKYDSTDLIKWIKSSQTVIKSGDPEAVALYEEYSEVIMPDFLSLTDNDISAIIKYIQFESEGGELISSDESTVTNTKSNSVITNDSQGEGGEESGGRYGLENPYTYFAYVILSAGFLVILAAILALSYTIKTLSNLRSAEHKDKGIQ